MFLVSQFRVCITVPFSLSCSSFYYHPLSKRMIEFIAIVKFHSSILQVLFNDVFKSSYKDAQFNVQMDGS